MNRADFIETESRDSLGHRRPALALDILKLIDQKALPILAPTRLHNQDRMEGTASPVLARPAGASEAILVKSDEMPPGSQKVEELDFNKFAGRSITVDDLVEGMNHMGFQASSIGEAIKIINEMVRNTFSHSN